jgi:hypothetical protein
MTPRRDRTASVKTAADAKSSESRTGWQTGLPPGILLFLAIAAFFVWTATSSQFPFRFGSKKVDHYNLQAEGFLSGHLYLSQDPPKEMLALKDPLDPIANLRYRLHDASLYKGKYYIYFGPVPVITLFLPWRLITGSGMPNNFAIVLYVLAGSIFSHLLLVLLLRAAGIELSWIMKRIAIIAMALCQTAPVMLRRGYVYETALAAAYCFFFASLYFLARYLTAAKPVGWHAVLGGLFMGFTPGCRPNFIPAVAILMIGFAIFQWRYRRLSWPELKRDLLRVYVPIAACAGLLLWFNYARFDNPLEFGQSYNLVGGVEGRGLTKDHSYFLPNVYHLLIEKPLVLGSFPFLELSIAGNYGSLVWPPEKTYMEPIAGILWISPICLAAFVLPWLLIRFRRAIPPPVQFVLLGLFATFLLNILSISLVVLQMSQRYELDVAPPVLLVAMFTVAFLAAQLAGKWRRRLAFSTIALMVGVSTAAQAALSINSYDNPMLPRDVPDFNQIAAFFGDDEMSTLRYVLQLSLAGEIKFPTKAPGVREALISTGFHGRSNAIVIEYLANQKVRFGFYQTGPKIAFGPEQQIEPGRLYSIHFTYHTDPGPRLGLDGKEVLAGKFGYVHPTSFAHAAVGRDVAGEIPGLQPFSGELISPAGLQVGAAMR